MKKSSFHGLTPSPSRQVVVLPIFCVIASVRALLKQPESRERFSVCAMRYSSIVIAAAGMFYLVAALR